MIKLVDFTIFLIFSLASALFFCLIDGYVLFCFKDGVLNLLAKDVLPWKDYLRLGLSFLFTVWLGASQYKCLSGIKSSLKG